MDKTSLIEKLESAVANGCPAGPTSWFYETLVPKDIESNLAFRQLIWELSEDPAIQQELIVICSRDLLFYVNVFGWTLGSKDYKDCPTRPFITYGFQDESLLAIAACLGECDLAVPKSRDMGASWMCLIAMEWRWHFYERQTFLLSSEKLELVDSKSERSLFKKLDFWWGRLPKWLMPEIERSPMHCRNLATMSDFDGEATIANLGTGDRRTAILLDEAAKMKNAKKISESTQQVSKCRIWNSTFWGRFGIGQTFFDRARKSETKKVFLHWSDHPAGVHPFKRDGLYRWREDGTKEMLPADYDWKDDYDFQELRFRKRKDGMSLGPRSPWYDLEVARADNLEQIAQDLDLDAHGSAERLATEDVIDLARREYGRPCRLRGEVLPDGDSVNNTKLNRMRPVWREGGGNLELWCDLVATKDEPIRLTEQMRQRNAPPRIVQVVKPEAVQRLRNGRPPKGTYAIGCDISAGTGGSFSSYSVMSVWNCRTGEQVGEWRSNLVKPDQMGVKAVVLGKWFWDAMIVPEINGNMGKNFLDKLIECEYPRIYQRNKSEVEAIETKTSKLGWHSAEGPGGILQSLLAALSQEDERFRAKPRSLLLLDELLEYEWVGEGQIVHVKSKHSDRHSDKGKAHGDAAVAAALGWMGVIECDLLTAADSSSSVLLVSKTAMDDWYNDGQQNRYAETAGAFDW